MCRHKSFTFEEMKAYISSHGIVAVDYAQLHRRGLSSLCHVLRKTSSVLAYCLSKYFPLPGQNGSETFGKSWQAFMFTQANG
jgi:hypothetical protein